MTRFRAVPISRLEAQAFIRQHHRHHANAPAIDLFRVALAIGAEIIGVAMVCRPVATVLDDGVTAEVARLCLIDREDTKHAASLLYAKCWRIARELGYTRLLTYTLADETGVSLVAAGWRVVHHTRPRPWNHASRPRIERGPLQVKTLWEASA